MYIKEKWEIIGNTKIDLSDYVTKTDGNLFYDNIQITSNDAVSDEEKSMINSIIDNIK